MSLLQLVMELHPPSQLNTPCRMSCPFLLLHAGARAMDLAPSAQGGEQAALPEVVIVFVQVVGAATFSYKRNRSEAHALKKAVTCCMLQMLDELPETDEGRDGYLCRCQEADLKYMVSFRAAHMALQWCMLVQVGLLGMSVFLVA